LRSLSQPSQSVRRNFIARHLVARQFIGRQLIAATINGTTVLTARHLRRGHIGGLGDGRSNGCLNGHPDR